MLATLAKPNGREQLLHNVEALSANEPKMTNILIGVK
jgi:hypothetical protein